MVHPDDAIIDLSKPIVMPSTMKGNFSDASLRKAYRLIEKKLLWIAEVGGQRWSVVSERNGDVYDVHIVGEPQADDSMEIPVQMSCSCPNGRKSGGRPRCYHVAAALIAMGYDSPKKKVKPKKPPKPDLGVVELDLSNWDGAES